MNEQNEINRLQSEINLATLSASRAGSRAAKWLLVAVAVLAISHFGHVFLVSHAASPAPTADVWEDSAEEAELR